jgi:hypothetical protein
LTRADVREGFDCGAPELDEWLIRYSWQNQRANNAVTYVTVLDGRVVGYYAIAVANVTSESAPAPVAKNATNHVPCLLGRDWPSIGTCRAAVSDGACSSTH